jgi:insulysin
MLFLGSKKFPVEKDYVDYISKNSGTYNAYTATLHTNYMFSIANNAMEGRRIEGAG